MPDHGSPSGDTCTGDAMSNGEGSPRSETVEPGGPDSPAAANPQIDLRAELRESHVEEVLDKLDSEIVGLKAVKTRIRETAALLLVDQVRRRLELTTHSPTLHMSFTGNPGTGKTTVALRMSEILHRLGYVREGHLVIRDSRRPRRGSTSDTPHRRPREVIKRAMGGVLFIDEAYYLHRPENERDYGQESIEILLQVMENNRDDLVVILAGYRDKMDQFFQSNPGMRSRIAHHLDFADYSQEELLAISKLMLVDLNYELSAEAETTFAEYVARRMALPHFANARSIRNALDRARLRQANRLFAARTLTTRALMTIEPADILASRVFSESRPAAGA